MLQTGAALVYYKLGQTLLQIRAASLLQIGASVVTSVVTNWGSYYKLGQLLQVRAIIINWGITLLRVEWYRVLNILHCGISPII